MTKEYLVFCILFLQSSWIQASAKPRAFSLADKHIVGGDYVDIEKVPYQLSVQNLLLHTCGGAIISAEYALTAAHCNLLKGLKTKLITLTAGSKTLYLGGQWHYVEKTFSHPKYVTTAVDYDVAVFKVWNPFPVTNKIRPVPLPTQSEKDFLDFNQLATVSGYGVSEDTFLRIWLRKADVPLITRLRCQELYAAAEPPREITPRMICAGGLTQGDACQGDSGGPLVHKRHLIGLTSWGVGCNVLPGVYTNLFDPEIRSFIAKHTDK